MFGRIRRKNPENEERTDWLIATTRNGFAMSEEQSPQRSTGNAATPAALPDINAETYPFDMVMHLLDEAAYFTMFSMPARGSSRAILSRGSGAGAIGINIREALHRFSINVQPPTADGLSVSNIVGERLARFEHRWMFAPDGFAALPGREPPETSFDPARSQRFVMLDSVCRFENGKDGFRGFGTGRTFPTSFEGRSQVRAGAVGNIVEGWGKFRGLVGTYTYCGTISPDIGFTGCFLGRVMDPEGVLRTEKSLPDIQAIECPEPDVAYVLFRGQKRNHNDKTLYIFGQGGSVDGLELHPQIRLFELDCAIDGRDRLLTTANVGPVVGNMPAWIYFNVLNPGAPGTGTAPIRFKDYDDYIFTDNRGTIVGSFGFDGGAGRRLGLTNDDGGEGQAFTLKLSGAPGQQALRFGGFGPVVNGKGKLKDVQGLTCHNSVVGIAPHALSTSFVARINDPEHKLLRSRGSREERKAYVCEESEEDNSYKCERRK
jgi:hypothetical protein